jgi:hypothetical protein
LRNLTRFFLPEAIMCKSNYVCKHYWKFSPVSTFDIIFSAVLIMSFSLINPFIFALLSKFHRMKYLNFMRYYVNFRFCLPHPFKTNPTFQREKSKKIKARQKNNYYNHVVKTHSKKYSSQLTSTYQLDTYVKPTNTTQNHWERSKEREKNQNSEKMLCESDVNECEKGQQTKTLKEFLRCIKSKAVLKFSSVHF